MLYDNITGALDRKNKEYHIVTEGINMEQVKYIKYIDTSKTLCNDIHTIFRLYGIEAVRQVLIYEFVITYQAAGSEINMTHLSLLVDQMCHMGEIISIDRHGLSKIDVDPIAKASFEKTMDHFVHAAIFNEKDNMKSVSSRIALGRVIAGGTGAFDLLLNTNMLARVETTQADTSLYTDQMSSMFTAFDTNPILDDIANDTMHKIDFFNP